MNITKMIYSLEPKQQIFICRGGDRRLNDLVSSVRSIAYHMQERKFSVNKINQSIFSKKCGVLVTRIS